MIKKRQTYLPRIVGDKVMMGADTLSRLGHKGSVRRTLLEIPDHLASLLGIEIASDSPAEVRNSTT
jgi:hypothetical protein